VHDDFNERVDAEKRADGVGSLRREQLVQERARPMSPRNWPFTLLEYWQRTLAPDPGGVRTPSTDRLTRAAARGRIGITWTGFTDKVAIVTGGGSGDRGARLRCSSRRKARGLQSPTSPRRRAAVVVSEIEAAGGRARAPGRRRGPTRPAVEAMVADTVSAYGGLGHLAQQRGAALDQNRVDQDCP